MSKPEIVTCSSRTLHADLDALARTALRCKYERDLLLEACREIVGSVAWSPTFDRALKKVHAAIDKAEGRDE